jgi:hypothetical protein
LILCQTCIAATDHLDNEVPAKSSDSCHSSSIDEALVDEVLNDDHCKGVCDCDAVITAASTDKSSELKEKIKYSHDVYAYISPELVLSTRAPPACRISTLPERAILAPLQYTSILLI